ncbi:MAG TPA: DUF2786 domain-containing protein [Trebonia sp.]|jgi:hypothetical protein|nr:DUF2786 domain-containing protein [Trebonia sp.]
MAKAGRPRRADKDRDRQRAGQAGQPGRPGSPAARPPEAASPSGPGPAADQQELVAAAIGAAVQAVCDGAADAHGRHLDPLAIERAPGWTEAVSRALVGYLRASVATAWPRGWQPAELARHFGRELSAGHAAMVADMITAELLGYPAATVDARWAAQAAALEAAAPGPGAWWGSDAEYLRARYALGRDAEFIATVATAVETLHAFRHLPALERLLPLPGTARPATAASPAPASAAPADERMLSRIRSLLAKAESTEFDQEAEALSGRAQELMAKYSIDHALLAAQTGQAETPGGRRIPVDNPYEAPKATLLQIVAQANRCRVVWSRELGLVTVIGFPADLDAVELLFTSLLVQANTAMLRTAGQRDGAGRSRTRAFRQSFLLAYAVRIGERLSEAADHAEQEAVAAQQAAADGAEQQAAVAARKGTDLVPFLAARHRAVDDAVEEMFGAGLTRSRSVRATDADGWNSGRAAADLASLRNHAQVAG